MIESLEIIQDWINIWNIVYFMGVNDLFGIMWELVILFGNHDKQVCTDIL